MISVAEARARLLEGMHQLPAEQVGIANAAFRVLAEDVAARVTKPPRHMSAMDGYAVSAADVSSAPVTLRQVGAVPAGQSYDRQLGPGETVRIFTGAPLPDGADSIVIQEDVDASGDDIHIAEAVPKGKYVRAAGLDFAEGDVGVAAGTWLTARHIALAAAMNRAWLSVVRRPRVAILATGDEIVNPGDPVGANQIVSSNALGLAALMRGAGADPIDLGIAPDETDVLQRMAAGAAGADMLVTTGGASVGDHDLVASALGEIGLKIEFWKIAMRPGKPLMFGALNGTPVVGLPGNPVSSLVCAMIFLVPMLRKMLGLDADHLGARKAVLAAPLAANDRREDYLRTRLAEDGTGVLRASPFSNQDSSLLSPLAAADGLLVRPPHAPALAAGDTVNVLPFAALHTS